MMMRTGTHLPVDNLVAWLTGLLPVSDRKQVEQGIGYIRSQAVDGLMTVVYTLYSLYIPRMSDIYSHSVCPDPSGTNKQVELPKSKIELGDLKEKTLLFVNVASKCGMSLS